MSFVVLILLGVLVWAVFLFALTAMLSRAPDNREEMIRVSRIDRRRGDRRIGMPDPRDVRVERRSGHDRRSQRPTAPA